MKRKSSCPLLVSLALAYGCATQPAPPLFFGEVVTFGIDIGTGPGLEGVDFTLGYKDGDVAIVPVSAVNTGKAQEIGAWNQERGGNRRDALSVFGQFEAKGGKTAEGGTVKAASSISLGRFFATGLAATSLAEGYRKGWASCQEQQEPKACLPSGSAGSPAAETASKALPEDRAPRVQDSAGSAPPETAANQAYAPPLVFAQSNTLGIGITTTAAATQGPHFTLGYTGRDVAFVPVMARNKDGSLVRLGSRDQVDPDGSPISDPRKSTESDALSVFGRFKADTETTSVDFGLSRFFTTGLAARNLAEGFSAAISSELRAQQQKPANSGK